MVCRHCGMQSRNTDVCEWCRKPLAGGDTPTQAPPQPLGAPVNPSPSATSNPSNSQLPPLPLNVPTAVQPLYTPPPAQPLYTPPPAQTLATSHSATPAYQDLTQPVPPPNLAPQTTLPLSGMTQRMSLSGEMIDVPAAAAPLQAPGQGYAVPPGTAQAPQTPTRTPYDLPVAAISPQLMRTHTENLQSSPDLAERFELFLALALPLLLGSILLVHLNPALLIWVSIADSFLISLMMGATGAIPSFDDAYADVSVMMVVTFLLGPLVALVVHFVVGIFRQEWNQAIIGLLGLQLLIFYALTLAMLSSSNITLSTVLLLGMANLISTFRVFLAFGAWILSGFFRPFEVAN